MSLTRSDVDAARNFWVADLISDERFRAARESADSLVVARALAGKLGGLDVDDAEMKDLRDVAMAYEIAASGTVSSLADGIELRSGGTEERRQMQAQAFVAYDLLRAIPSDENNDMRYLDTLTLCALGYLGDRGVDLQTVLDESAEPPTEETLWDKTIFYALYDCWRILFKPRVGDYGKVIDAIGALRGRQGAREPQYLLEAESEDKALRAYRLLALYNLARATELLAAYMRSGSSSTDNAEVDTLLDRYFEDARSSAILAGDRLFELLTWWLHAAAKRMTELSIWRFERGALGQLVRRLASEAKQLYQLLPPQRAALLSAGVLDAAHTAIVVDMPTSSGKTLLAEFRLAQTLAAARQNGKRPWGAYVVPTRALASQIVRQLRADLRPELVVEALSGAVEVDALEKDLLANDNAFDILVCTPEKLASLIRGNRVDRDLAIVVVDEAHSIGDKSRGIRIELLLATLRQETQAEFMLMMPYVPNAAELAAWLSREGEGGSVSLGATPWKPNDVLIGTFQVADGSSGPDWTMEFRPYLTPRSLTMKQPALPVQGKVRLKRKAREVRSTAYLAGAAIASALDDIDRGTNLVMCRDLKSTWKAAAALKESLPPLGDSDDRDLVKRFVQTEVSPDFALAELLDHAIAVHHAGLPDDVRSLVEELAQSGQLRALCATTTIAQGMNFDVGSVFLTALTVYDPGTGSRDLEPRDFWNVAGRAGRVGQSSVGVVGVVGTPENSQRLEAMIANLAQELDSHFEFLLRNLDISTPTGPLRALVAPEWADFRSYVAHMCANTERPTNRDADLIVRQTLTYKRLQSSPDPADKARANALLNITRTYTERLAKDRGLATIADNTGFSPDAVSKVLGDMRGQGFTKANWTPQSLFSGTPGSILPRLIGAMMKVPQIHDALKDLGGTGDAHRRIAEVTTDWVNGLTIEQIAKKYFSSKGERELSLTDSLSAASRAIFKNLTYAAPWGISALMQVKDSGIDFDALSDAEKRELDLLPAYIYHGVKTEDAVAMRINSVPRSIAPSLAAQFSAAGGPQLNSRVASARQYLEGLTDRDWDAARPPSARLSGAEYRKIWARLSA